MKSQIFKTPNSGSLLKHEGGGCKRYKKEIARVGKYEQPSTGKHFEFTKPWLQGRVETFNRMKANGVRVKVPLDHKDHDSSKNKGWIEDITLEGDSLFVVADLYGDGADLALTTDVSMYVPAKWRDGKGNDYDWPIRSVALTDDPCLPGLGPWEQLALSAEEYDDVEVLTYQPNKEEPMEYKTIATALNLSLETDEGAEEKIVKAIEDLKLSATPVEPAVPDPEPIPESEPATPVTPVDDTSPLILSMAKLTKVNRGLQLDALAGAAKINKAAREKIESAFCGDSLALSLSSGTPDGFDAVCEAFAMMEPLVLTGEKTGVQAVDPNTDGASAADSKAEQDRWLAAAGH